MGSASRKRARRSTSATSDSSKRRADRLIERNKHKDRPPFSKNTAASEARLTQTPNAAGANEVPHAPRLCPSPFPSLEVQSAMLPSSIVTQINVEVNATDDVSKEHGIFSKQAVEATCELLKLLTSARDEHPHAVEFARSPEV